MFANRVSSGALYTTWEWDGHHWFAHTPANSPSEYLLSPGLAYDRNRKRTVLFGGRTFTTGRNDDLWEWDGSDWTLRPPTVGPSARSDSAFAYDLGRQRTVLFGGHDGSFRNDTWEWDGTVWLERFPTTQPPARRHVSMACDEGRNRLVLFASDFGAGDTWEWDGTNWTQLNPVTSPPTASTAAMTYDAARGRVVVVAPNSAAGVVELWEWDGANWTQLPSAPTAQVHAFGYDPILQQLVLIDGHSDTWLFGPTSAAAVREYGTGCAGSEGVPTFSARGRPTSLNPRFKLELASGRRTAPAVFALATGQASLPLGACTLLVDPVVASVPVGTNGGGFAELPIPIPGQPLFVGLSLWAQAWVLDPQGAFGGVVALTNGIELTVGG